VVTESVERDGSADSRMNDGKPPAPTIQLVDRVVARLTLAVVDVARPGALAHEFPDHFLEKAQNAVLGDVDGFDGAAWFDDR
jgi:hypothetical protein